RASQARGGLQRPALQQRLLVARPRGLEERARADPGVAPKHEGGAQPETSGAVGFDFVFAVVFSDLQSDQASPDRARLALSWERRRDGAPEGPCRCAFSHNTSALRVCEVAQPNDRLLGQALQEVLREEPVPTDPRANRPGGEKETPSDARERKADRFCSAFRRRALLQPFFQEGLRRLAAGLS